MSQRKLLQEIDKVFKKVKEGLEIFDGYYDKLMNCESQSQKEKLESDLKREIKKLQRQRDQIKNWLSGNEVKDKNQLLENRRLIENAMERFKVVEKNMKTKAFSKEGLSMERIDPKEKEKHETSEFLHQMLEEIERQCEKHEATIDQLHSSVKKGKKLDVHKQSEVDELEEKLERNHWHTSKLETILRHLENDDLECDQINALQDDIKYYVESNEDADFMEDDTIYDELNLPENDEAYGTIGEFAPVEQLEEEELDSKLENTPKKLSVSALPPPQLNNNPAVNAIPPASTSTQNANATTANAPSPGYVPIPASTSNTGSPASSTTTTSTPVLTNANISKPPGLTPVISNTPLKSSNIIKPELKYSAVVSGSVSSSRHGTPSLAHAQLANNSVNSKQITNNETLSSSISQTTIKDSKTFDHSHDENEDTTSILADLIPNFEKLKQNISKPVPFEDISKILENSLLNCPDSFDSEKPKDYYPETPFPTSIHYPQEPIPELTYPSILGRLDLSTLFFNFYYRQSEYIQILSARELVKKGWKYDTISYKWFQKIEEIQPPSLVGDQIMNSEKKIAWKYFDNEGVWLPRRKDDFDINSVNLETNF